ncbi:hypothetical protein B9Z65_8261 [Elsinoe australis]|uniref:DNA repair protein rhp42 n=1 Tax=Elsinoe australis TaxID=40998 RepID=A0A2P7YDB1_9PEZI|nr:hypothetical protein B9Z65_8261 [Elsinoe australis]
MPPHVSRKRHASPDTSLRAKRSKRQPRGKSTVFDTIDASTSAAATPEQTKEYLNGLNDSDSSSSEDGDDHDFEDVPGLGTGKSGAKPEGDGDEEDEMDWEDAIGAGEPDTSMTAPADDVDIGDVTVTLSVDGKYATAADKAASTLKKGPSKREREVRNGTHCIHVQALMWHNTIRNSWLNDKELQDILVKGLSEGVQREIDKWREDMGMPKDESRITSQKRRKKGKVARQGAAGKRGGRDWDVDAERQEKGAVNLSRGDPTLRLLKLLTAYWRKRFTVTAPGVRKLGYMPLKRLTQEINSWKRDRNDFPQHGERIESVKDLRRLARECEGSRDVGSQLFTALLRGIGLEARMVANLQPAGIGWGKVEEAKPPRDPASASKKKAVSEDSDSDISEVAAKRPKAAPRLTKKSLTPRQTGTVSSGKNTRKSTRNESEKVISLDTDSGSGLSSAPSDLEDDASVVDITDTFTKTRPNKKYDRDMHYPNYWTEVLSSISNTYVPVDPIVLSTVATNGELLATFEPRGKRADQAKQVICYTVAHSPDGTAKDVTVRYLKKHQLPGRTKGYRMPVEKIKVYNRKGKVRKYEEYDWFKTVMSVFNRPAHLRTAADDLEESTDLKPFKADSEKPKAEVESLQWYKQSADFVLERHLRREEAIPPWAKPVKSFKAGKGDKAEEEPVYRRSDVLLCKTAESWHKEGREIKMGEQPMKLVPMRAVTTMRKREMEEVERETGEKAKQGLFSRDQTDWIIPPPIGPDREIPRNAFGNIDVYVPSMVPKGAVHLPLKGTARICRDLNISYAEAVTGFEFGKRMAIPVITGVVIPEEHEKEVREIWREKEKEKKRKEDEKKTQLCLQLWRKFFSGLRIVERMKREYADTGREEEINPFVRKGKTKREQSGGVDEDVKVEAGEDLGGGGFLLPGEGDNDEEEGQKKPADIDLGGGGFIVESAEGDQLNGEKAMTATPLTPMSMQSAHAQVEHEDLDNEDDGDDEEQEEREVVRPIKANRTSTPKRPGRTSAAKARSKLKESDEDSDGVDDDGEEASSGLSSGESEEPAASRRKKNTPTARKAPAWKSTPRASATKRKSPTKSQYFPEPGRRRSARNAN